MAGALNDSRLPEEDRRLAEVLLKQGGGDPAHLEECAVEILRLLETGAPLIPSLRELLEDRGYLDPRIFGETQKVSSTPRPSAPLPPPAAEAERDPSNRIGRYIRVSKLGAGGMGEVWRAWDPELGRWVALKFLKGDDPDELARFRREAQTAAQLVHPNIAAVFEVGDHGGKPFIAMQRVDGQTLQAFPRQDHTLLAELVRDAALAVHAAHEKNVIHRDLKPANIMVEGRPPDRGKTSRRGPEPHRPSGVRVYVMDFGLAKSTTVQSDLSISGMAVGTPGYMSPEQIRGERSIDGRTDIYSLGATLFELLTGRTPFVHSNMVDLLRQALDDDPPSVRRINPRVDPDLQTIVMKCLEKEPGRRYESAKDLADDLTRWLEREPILAHPPSMFYRLRRKISRHRALSTAIGVSILLLVGFGIYVVATSADRKREKEELAARTKAAALYRDAGGELRVLRLRSYRPGWRLTEEEFALFEDLIARCRAQLNETGDDPEGWGIVGRAYDVLGDWKRALDAYDRGLAADPHHSFCLANKARLLAFRARAEGLRRDPTAEREERARALIDSATALLEKAKASIDLDLARGYEFVVRRERSDEYCDRMLQKWRDTDFWEEFYLIRGLASGETLIDDATEAIRLRPGFFEAYFWRGTARRMLGEFAAALADFDEVVRINPRFTLAYHERGFVRLLDREYDGAIADFTRALEIDPHLLLSLVHRARAKLAKRDVEGALKDADAAVEQDPEHQDIRLLRGDLRFELKRFVEASKDYSAVIRAYPDHAEAYHRRGAIRVRLRDVKGAAEDFARAAELDPLNAKCHNSLGNIRVGEGDLKGAVENYTRALEADPDYALALVNRAGAFARLKQFEAAIADCTRAIELDPNSRSAYTNRGFARYELGDFKGAEEDFSALIRLRVPTAFRLRGSARLGTGDLDGAAKDFETGLRIRPKDPVALYGLARVRARQSAPDRAFTLLEQALNAGYSKPERLRSEPDFRSLHDDPRWTKLLNR